MAPQSHTRQGCEAEPARGGQGAGVGLKVWLQTPEGRHPSRILETPFRGGNGSDGSTPGTQQRRQQATSMEIFTAIRGSRQGSQLNTQISKSSTGEQKTNGA